MKKFVLLLLATGIIFSLSACGGKDSPPATSTEPEQMEFAEFQWPDTDIAKLMPVPKSTIGNISWSHDYGFVIYVAETSMDDYAAYVDKCESRGFTVEARKGDDYFYADNEDGYHVAVNHQDGDVMFIRIDEPKAEETEPVSEPPEETPIPTEAQTAEPEKTASSQPTEPEPTSTPEPEPSKESDTPKDDYSDSAHRSKAVQAFQNYGDYICPYGIEYHWFHQNVSQYEGNGVWYFKVGVTITNQFNATREAVAEGRVSFIAEEVTEFELLDSWD